MTPTQSINLRPPAARRLGPGRRGVVKLNRGSRHARLLIHPHPLLGLDAVAAVEAVNALAAVDAVRNKAVSTVHAFVVVAGGAPEAAAGLAEAVAVVAEHLAEEPVTVRRDMTSHDVTCIQQTTQQHRGGPQDQSSTRENKINTWTPAVRSSRGNYAACSQRREITRNEEMKNGGERKKQKGT